MGTPFQAAPNAALMADQQTRCLNLRRDGKTIRQIAEITGLAKSTVQDRIDVAIKELVVPAAEEVRKMELDRLDLLIDKAMDVLTANHIVVQFGKIVLDGSKPDDGEPDLREPVRDHGPVLQAIATLQRLSESRRKLLGTDAPQKVDATVHEVDQSDLELAQIIREAEAKTQLQRQQYTAPTTGQV